MATFLKTIKKTVKYWYVPAIIGVLLIVFGIYIFTTPLETYGTLTMLFSLSFLFSGIAETLFSVQNRKIIEGWGWYLTGGIFNSVIGLMLLSRPEISAFTLPLVVGFTLMFRSIQGLGFSFELKNYGSLKWGGESCHSKYSGTCVFHYSIIQPNFHRNIISGNDSFSLHFFWYYGNCIRFSTKETKSSTF